MNKINEIKVSESLMNILINIENVRLAPGWLVNIDFPFLWLA